MEGTFKIFRWLASFEKGEWLLMGTYTNLEEAKKELRRLSSSTDGKFSLVDCDWSNIELK
jgi:hypothetical protein